MFIYIFNRFLIKIIDKIFFENWICRKLILSYLYVWGCKIKVRFYNFYEKKLEERLCMCFFVGNLFNLKRFRFYSLSKFIRLMEIVCVIFLDDIINIVV